MPLTINTNPTTLAILRDDAKFLLLRRNRYCVATLIAILLFQVIYSQQNISNNIVPAPAGRPFSFYNVHDSTTTKPVDNNNRQMFAPTISCPSNFSTCIPFGNTTYTHNSNSLNASVTLDAGCSQTSLTYTSSGAGVTPATGNTLNGAV